MKISVPDHVNVYEGDAGGMFVDTISQWQLKLDAHELMLWKFFVAEGNAYPAKEGEAQQAAAPDDRIHAEAHALLGKLIAYGFVRKVDDAGSDLDAANAGRGARFAKTWLRFREWLGWRLDKGFDSRFGTDTSGRLKVSEMGVTSPNAEFAVYYEATPARVFRKALRLAVPDPEGYVFVDYGSGKGRALLLASDLPFTRVIGVELSGQLHLTAQHNIRRYRGGRLRCADVASVCGDATSFDLPDDDLVIYFYTPFIGPVFDKVLGRIGEAVAKRPRRLVVFTYSSRMDQIARLAAQPYLTRHRELRLGFEWTRVAQRSLHVFYNH